MIKYGFLNGLPLGNLNCPQEIIENFGSIGINSYWYSQSRCSFISKIRWRESFIITCKVLQIFDPGPIFILVPKDDDVGPLVWGGNIMVSEFDPRFKIRNVLALINGGVHIRDGPNQTEEIIEDLDWAPLTSETSTNSGEDDDDGYWSTLDSLDVDHICSVDKDSEWSEGGGLEDEQFDQNKVLLDLSSSPGRKNTQPQRPPFQDPCIYSMSSLNLGLKFSLTWMENTLGLGVGAILGVTLLIITQPHLLVIISSTISNMSRVSSSRGNNPIGNIFTQIKQNQKRLISAQNRPSSSSNIAFDANHRNQLDLLLKSEEEY
ncbi:hypothetical protein LIER_12737 [Lithospermum erythrorhizon]|uniref:Uncharacterized protein n=1 Tax=Lithospermum erythrorhizon TaxID=34254 RepID=A0AAV3PV18_LITER